MQLSERSKSNLKPRFPRLKFLEKKRSDNLRFYADEEFMLHVIPNVNSVHTRKGN